MWISSHGDQSTTLAGMQQIQAAIRRQIPGLSGKRGVACQSKAAAHANGSGSWTIPKAVTRPWRYMPTFVVGISLSKASSEGRTGRRHGQASRSALSIGQQDGGGSRCGGSGGRACPPTGELGAAVHSPGAVSRRRAGCQLITGWSDLNKTLFSSTAI